MKNISIHFNPNTFRKFELVEMPMPDYKKIEELERIRKQHLEFIESDIKEEKDSKTK